MKHFIIFICIICMTLYSAKVLNVSGKVLIIEGNNIQQAYIGQNIKSDAVIKTTPGSVIFIRINDNTKKIDQNSTVKLEKYKKEIKVKRSFNSILKLAKKNNLNLHTASAVAGVRGAEQGKSTFSPIMVGQNTTKKSFTEYDQATIAYNNDEYLICITKLKNHLSKTNDERAFILLSACYLELFQLDDAIKVAEAGLKITSIEETISELKFNICTAYILDNKYKDILSITYDNSDTKVFWKLQAIKYIALDKLEMHKKAKELKKDISINCTYQDIIDSIQ